MNRLTIAAIKATKPPPRTASGSAPRRLYGDGGGLWLQVRLARDSDEVRRSWLFRYSREIGDRRKFYEMGLGPYPDITLAMARDKAQEARRHLLAGTDPLDAKEAVRAARKAEAAVPTFDECRDRFITAQESGWQNEKHAAQWRASLTAYVTPIFGSLPVNKVGQDHVVRALEPIWSTKRETASRVRGRIEAILNWAKTKGYRSGDNPALWKGNLSNLLAKGRKVVTHHPAMPYADLPAFMPKLRAQEGMGARALEFAILTATRSGEVRLAMWSEINLKAKVWTIPAERMKAKKEHRVPLSDAALALLARVGRVSKEDCLVFPGRELTEPLSDMSLLAVLRRMDLDCVPHGFRSTFRDWAAEKTSFANHVVEAALAHTISDKVEAAYRRGDLFEHRRKLMEEWARYGVRI